MTIKDMMKYIESEYTVINETPCEVCGGEFFADELKLSIVDDIPYDVCSCICSNCGHEKIFEFHAPFIELKTSKKLKKNLN